MNRIIKRISYSLLLLFISIKSFSQADTASKKIPMPLQYNAGFDVIIKMNGDILYGIVKEVGVYMISYQRTDIPDGPIYYIARTEVYAISYRNQVKDFINGLNGDYSNYRNENYNRNNRHKYPDEKKYWERDSMMFRNEIFHIGVGFLRSYSKVEDVNDYNSSVSFPVTILAYDLDFKKNIRLGAMICFGSRKFTTQQFSSYDSTQNDITQKENIFSIYVYGKYSFLNNTSVFQPYILAGLGINSSHIKSENIISFTDDNSQKILVQSGSRSANLGIAARIGITYLVSEKLKVFADAGTGLSIINAGVSLAVK